MDWGGKRGYASLALEGMVIPAQGRGQCHYSIERV